MDAAPSRPAGDPLHTAALPTPPATLAETAAAADDAEALAFADLYAAAPPELRDRLGLRVDHVADATLLLAPGLPTPLFNRAIGLGLRQQVSAEVLERIDTLFHQAGCNEWWVHAHPLAHPAELGTWLQARGYALPPRHSWAKMLHDGRSLPTAATPLRAAPATDAQVDAVTATIAQVFGMPTFMAQWLRALHGRRGWRLYGLTDGPQVVGGAALFRCATSAGELAWLGMAAVAPTHRRRGGQRALMVRRVADARAGGASHVITETGEPIGDEPNPSLRNMAWCGFVRVASRLNYARA